MIAEPLLDAADIRRALRALGDELAKRSVVADVYVFGGAAMVLAFNADRPTRDIDAKILSHHGAVTEAVAVVARKMGLPRNWLNEQATVVYLPDQLKAGRAPVFDHPNLRVMSAPPELLLAMKLRRAQERDVPHIRLLLDYLRVADVEKAMMIASEQFPDDPLPPARARALLEDLLGGPG
jgi:hypothetical protein